MYRQCCCYKDNQKPQVSWKWELSIHMYFLTSRQWLILMSVLKFAIKIFSKSEQKNDWTWRDMMKLSPPWCQGCQGESFGSLLRWSSSKSCAWWSVLWVWQLRAFDPGVRSSMYSCQHWVCPILQCILQTNPIIVLVTIYPPFSFLCISLSNNFRTKIHIHVTQVSLSSMKLCVYELRTYTASIAISFRAVWDLKPSSHINYMNSFIWPLQASYSKLQKEWSRTTKKGSPLTTGSKAMDRTFWLHLQAARLCVKFYKAICKNLYVCNHLVVKLPDSENKSFLSSLKEAIRDCVTFILSIWPNNKHLRKLYDMLQAMIKIHASTSLQHSACHIKHLACFVFKPNISLLCMFTNNHWLAKCGCRTVRYSSLSTSLMTSGT